jgi:hypothetical protein
MGNNTWANSLDPFTNVRSTIVNTFTTARDVSSATGQPVPTTAGDELKVGSLVEITAVLALSTTGTPTFRCGFAYGITSAGGLLSTGVELAGSALTATGSGAAAWPVKLWYLGKVTAVGTAGVIYGQGIQSLGSSLTAIGDTAIPVTAGARSATIDTTAKKTWHVFAEFGTSNAANQIQVDVFDVTIRNQGKPGQA